MNTAVKGTLAFDAMADDFTIAVLAFWRERVDCAFEAVKIMGLTQDGNFQGFVVVVPANFTFMPHHTAPSLSQCFRCRVGVLRGRLRPCDHVRRP